jgi:hypothetical protein
VTTVDEEFVPDFREDGDEAEEAAKKEGGGGGRWDRIRYFRLEDDGDKDYLRFLTEKKKQKYVLMHQGVVTKELPAELKEKFKNWPGALPAVCRKDKILQPYFPNGCYICDSGMKNSFGDPNTPKIKVWALAVRREPIIGTEAMTRPLITAEQVGQPIIGTQEMADLGFIKAEHVGQAIMATEAMAKPLIRPEHVGRRVGFKDKTVTLTRKDPSDPEGKKTIQVTEPDIVVVNQSSFNFFTALNALHEINDTLCDRDYMITRKGEKKSSKVKYLPAPMDPVPGVEPGTEVWDYYLQCVKNQEYDLNKIIFNMANDRYYGRFIDPNIPFPEDMFEDKKKDGESGGTATAAQAAPISQQVTKPTEISESQAADLRSKILGRPAADPAPAEA